MCHCCILYTFIWVFEDSVEFKSLIKDTLIRVQWFYEYCNTCNYLSCILIDTAQIPRKLFIEYWRNHSSSKVYSIFWVLLKILFKFISFFLTSKERKDLHPMTRYEPMTFREALASSILGLKYFTSDPGKRGLQARSLTRSNRFTSGISYFFKIKNTDFVKYTLPKLSYFHFIVPVQLSITAHCKG